ncbi:MAG TPA: DUF1800 domain-containing protein [Bacteroidetes bacterium]|nr:DUF1800 domain-containing protein [Bacteroidota bacterium]
MTVSTIDRRTFLKRWKNKGAKAATSKKGLFKNASPLIANVGKELPLVPAPTTSITLNGGLDPYTGPWDHEQVVHLLRRTMFGVKKEDVNLFLGMSMEQAVDYLLDVDTSPPDPPVNNYYYYDPDSGDEEGYQDPNVPFGDTWVNADYDEEAEGLRIESFRGWWLRKMIDQDVSIREKMVLFWHNHFATQASEVFFGKFNYLHNVKLREYALGNFKELTKAITLDGMMLIYLNGFLNEKDAPDENYARELQELFTIGKDDPNHYTEEDVVQAARVLTGWTLDFANNWDTIFYPFNHDTGNKQFSSFYNNTVIQGSSDGEAELDALLDMIFAKEQVARFLCRKLYRWFVYYKIDAQVEQNVIEPLAEIFRNNNYEIKPVLEALLKSEHFFDAVNKGCFIKTPVDVVVGTLRTYGLQLPAVTIWDGFVQEYFQNVMLADMQMLPGDPPNVAGWQAFRQFPQYYRMWINSDTARNRNFYTDVLTTASFESYEAELKIDHIAFASEFDHPEDPNLLIDDMVRLLLPRPVSDDKKALLKSILLSGLPNDSYWTAAWFDYISNPNDDMAFQVVNTRLTILHNYILKLPEYQLA